MHFIGLNLGGELNRMTVLDAAGFLVYEEVLPNTEAGLSQRLASLPSALIAAEYRASQARLFASLSAMGHLIVLSGPLPDMLVPALMPRVPRCGSPTVVLRKTGPGLGLAFAIAATAANRGSKAWYFIGPVPQGTDWETVQLARFEGAGEISALDQARWLHALWAAGELPDVQAPHEVAA
jgi:hypothetical protein